MKSNLLLSWFVKSCFTLYVQGGTNDIYSVWVGYNHISYLLQTSRNIIGLKWTRGNHVYSIHGQ
jgi:hypothetical protein